MSFLLRFLATSDITGVIYWCYLMSVVLTFSIPYTFPVTFSRKCKYTWHDRWCSTQLSVHVPKGMEDWTLEAPSEHVFFFILPLLLIGVVIALYLVRIVVYIYRYHFSPLVSQMQTCYFFCLLVCYLLKLQILFDSTRSSRWVFKKWMFVYLYSISFRSENEICGSHKLSKWDSSSE